MTEESRSSVTVRIGGEDYSIRADASPEHTRRCAEEVDRTLRQITSQGPFLEAPRAVILAALSLADQLLKARSEGERQRRELQAASLALTDRIRAEVAASEAALRR